MKILILGTAYPLRGGIAHYNALLASALAVRHTVEVITFRRQYPTLLFPGKTQQETGDIPIAEPAPRLVDSINPLNWIAVGRRIRRQKFDLIIFKFWMPFFGPCFGTIAKVARRGTDTKVLFICDNVIPHEHRPGDRAFTRYAFRQADCFIVQSGAVERDLKSFWPGAVYRNVPHPVYDIFGLPIGKQQARSRLEIRMPHVILFFGYIRAYKGLAVLLEAMAKLGDEQDVLLLVVGEFYENEEKYRSMIRDLGLASRVLLHSEYLPNSDVPLYFSAADVVVLPYLSATQSGIAQIAYNFDTPVIATDVGGLAEVVRDGVTGFIVPPNDAEALAHGIRRFFGEQREAEFEANVRVEKKRYTWDTLVTAIEEMVVR
jgi:glycosyltransferase involved in cell wall biosynthesis